LPFEILTSKNILYFNSIKKVFRNAAIAVLLLSAPAASAQVEPPSNIAFFGLGFQRTQFLYKNGSGLFAYLDAPLNENFSVQWSIGAGVADMEGFYTHVPLSFATSYVITNVTGFEFGLFTALICLIPESISYTINRTKRIDVRLTASPLGIYFWKSDKEWRDPIIPGAGVMLLVKTNSGNPFLKLHASAMYQISTDAPGIQFGAAFCLPLE
jgi:hypothetical protein